MKAMMMSIRPKWVANILNGEKTIEIRRKFPKDYQGWVYIYCTKADDLCKICKISRDRYICGKDYDNRDFPHLHSGYNGRGKVVARFWCDKVDEYVNGSKLAFENDTYIFGTNADFETILKPSCLTEDELYDYCEDLAFSAIHITKLEIFDKPKEIDDFNDCSRPQIRCSSCVWYKKYNGAIYDCEEWICPAYPHPLKKAPRNWCHIEV